jgi:isocitrate dehydrogenase kinase/phosphatase
MPKVNLRTLLFSTTKRGRIIENMHAMLYHNEAWQNFHIMATTSCREGAGYSSPKMA